MKKPFYIILVSFALASFCFGQDKKPAANNWTRVETEDKELSVSFPPDFLIDTEKKEDTGQRRRIIGFQNNVVMELSVYDEDEPKKRFERIPAAAVESKKLGSGKNAFLIKRFSSQDDARYFYQTIYLASEKSFYRLSVHTRLTDSPEFSRFLYSVKIGGKPIFINKAAADDAAEKIVSLAALNTSPEILEALNRKDKLPNRKITYVWDEEVKPSADKAEEWSRSFIILRQPFAAKASYAVKPSRLWRQREGNGKATIRIQLLANGQIGDMTVFSRADRALLYDLVAGMKEIRFLPAMKDGKPVDSEWDLKILASDY